MRARPRTRSGSPAANWRLGEREKVRPHWMPDWASDADEFVKAYFTLERFALCNMAAMSVIDRCSCGDALATADFMRDHFAPPWEIDDDRLYWKPLRH